MSEKSVRLERVLEIFDQEVENKISELELVRDEQILKIKSCLLMKLSSLSEKVKKMKISEYIKLKEEEKRQNDFQTIEDDEEEKNTQMDNYFNLFDSFLTSNPEGDNSTLHKVLKIRRLLDEQRNKSDE